MITAAIYAGAALAEMAGCFAVWAWLRLGHSPLWLIPGLISLSIFAYLLTLIDTAAAGGGCAAYGGVYIPQFAGVVVGHGGRAAGPLGRVRRGDLPDRGGGHHRRPTLIGRTESRLRGRRDSVEAREHPPRRPRGCGMRDQVNEIYAYKY